VSTALSNPDSAWQVISGNELPTEVPTKRSQNGPCRPRSAHPKAT